MNLKELKKARFYVESDDVGQCDIPDEQGECMYAHDVLPLIARVEKVVKEIRTTDCDGRDLPRFADMLEGK